VKSLILIVPFIFAVGCSTPEHSWKQQYDCCRPPETDSEIHQVYGDMDLAPVNVDRPNVFAEVTIYYPNGNPFVSWSHNRSE
jgi:hypothetical protein